MIVSQNCIYFNTKNYDSDSFPGHPIGEHMLGGRLAGWLAGWLAGRGTKMHQKRVPLARKCVKNVYP